MTTFEQVVTYVSEYDPRFRESIAGAGPEQLEELETLIGRELPDIYRDFLSVMGRGMGWIDLQKMDFGIDSVLAYYRNERWLPTERFIRIGYDPKEPSYHPHLELSFFSDETRVVRFPDCKPDTLEQVLLRFKFPLAGSLPEMVCLPVFHQYELHGEGRSPVKLTTREWNVEALAQADSLAAVLGFERLWWSSETGRGYRREDAALEAVQLGGYPLELSIRADSRDEQVRLVGHFTERLEAFLTKAR